jgi:REP element-mobilizing transposase RayT
MPRIKAKRGKDGLYHCMSRTVGGDFLFGEKEKEVFVRMMWRVAIFLGIEILDYVVMSNHYHQLVRVPGVVKLSDQELLDRLKSYYGEESHEVIVFLEALDKGDEAADDLRAVYLKRMGNVSEFEKILKQGFSVWYNKRHKRLGTLWMERFKSVLVEDSMEVRRIMATYIDLNPVRAGMVEDPKDYRHCGFAAAMGGDKRCQRGIMDIMGSRNWKEAASAYRMVLMERGHRQVYGKKGAIRRDLLVETLKQNGELTRPELLLLRVRYFSDGLVLGSEIFVEEVFQQYRSHFGEKRKSGARPIREFPDGALKVIRDLRLDPVS